MKTDNLKNKSKMPSPVAGKIIELEDLPALLNAERAKKKKIVHCHGVFDLLHVGHIRHFKQAKKFGDILVVTITPDRYVNKGPNRPAFHENLRLEVLASLDVVDYVALNKWPMATEAIKIIRPDFYVKGSDYKDASKDHTGGILLEEEAVKANGGKLVFTKDIIFSSSSLINRHLPVFPKEISEYLSNFSSRFTADDIFSWFEKARPMKVLVIGESILDEYQYCEAIGKSSKEPMLAVKRLSTEKFAGGILAVGNHAANFCDTVGLVSMLGDQNPQEEFIREKLSKKITPTFVYRTNSPTIVKRRFIESYFFTKLMEIYEINDGSLETTDNAALCAALETEIPKYDVVIVVDFGHNMLSREAIQVICEKSKFLTINAQSNAGNLGYQTILRYPRADYVCMAENEIRLEARDRRGDLKKMVLAISKKIGCERLTVTRGKNGSLCYSKKEGFIEVPALAGQVIDRMGAGDAVLSITSLCAAQGAPTEVVGFVGNVVGAQAVATVGNRTAIERAPLFKHIESLLKH